MDPMQLLDLTFSEPVEDLRLDEFLLDLCEKHPALEVLRFWAPRRHFVVLGYASQSAEEVNLDLCRALKIPVLRRISGGGTVLQGPGCINFSLVLRIDRDPALRTITGTNTYVLERHRRALQPLLSQPVVHQGSTDLALGNLKFSGNAQRRKKSCLLFHGTFLLGLDLPLVERVLPVPARQPPYRNNRPHREFLVNLPLQAAAIKQVLRSTWKARRSSYFTTSLGAFATKRANSNGDRSMGQPPRVMRSAMMRAVRGANRIPFRK